MTDDSSTDTLGWLEHPEVQNAYEMVTQSMMPESDRGAALMAAEIISEHLESALRRRAPTFLTDKKLVEIFSYPGVASSLASKTDIAALNDIIDKNVYTSINCLRKIRNRAAHSKEAFSLQTENDRIDEILNLGSGVPTAVNNMAVEMLVLNMFESLRRAGEDLKETLGENPFSTKDKIIEELEKREGWSKPLEERLPRLKLGLGLCLIIWLIKVREQKYIKGPQPTPPAC